MKHSKNPVLELVREERLELSRLSAPDFESSVSTDFTTRAKMSKLPRPTCWRYKLTYWRLFHGWLHSTLESSIDASPLRYALRELAG